MKLELISKRTYTECGNVHSSLSLYSVIGLTQKLLIRMSLFQASKHTFFIFNIDCCFGSTCIYEVTFVASVWLHYKLILHQNGIFHVNGAKMQLN